MREETVKYMQFLGESVQAVFWTVVLWALAMNLLDRVVEVKVFRYAAF